MSHSKNKFIMVGGFLGAGKTTALNYLAKSFSEINFKVGLITNDQGSHLVDTNILKSNGHLVSEIPDGCFCCKFSSLKDAADQLTKEDRPDIFLAEPVGSCTDLVASISYPLRRIYKNDFQISPFLVLADPLRTQRMLGLKTDKKFSDDISYIFQQQLLEADIIAVTKTDIYPANEIKEILNKLKETFPEKKITSLSFKQGENIADVIEDLLNGVSSFHALTNLDYRKYAEGEKKLGWVNLSFKFETAQPINSESFLKNVHELIIEELNNNDYLLAHLKTNLIENNKVVTMQQTSNEDEATYFNPYLENLTPSDLVINCRFEGFADKIGEVLINKLSGRTDLILEHKEIFQPILLGPPSQRESADAAIICACAYTKLLKEPAVQNKIAEYIELNQNFHIIPDLCSAAATQPDELKQMLMNRPKEIAACYPRAVKGIFHLAGVLLPNEIKLCNMRSDIKVEKK